MKALDMLCINYLWYTAISLSILISRDGHRFMQCQNPLTGHWCLVISHTTIMLSNHLSYPFIKAIAHVAIGFKMLVISIIFWPLVVAWNHFISCLYWDKFTRITICADMTVFTKIVRKTKIGQSCSNRMFYSSWDVEFSQRYTAVTCHTECTILDRDCF